MHWEETSGDKVSAFLLLYKFSKGFRLAIVALLIFIFSGTVL
jgi:hypothetical protein